VLLIFLALLVWIPAVVGWAGWLPWLRRRLGDAAPAFDVWEPVAGLAALATVATIVHFVAGLSPRVDAAVLVAGWTLLWLRLRRTPPRIASSVAVLATVWLAILAFGASRPPRAGDAGLYYLQTIDWLTGQPLALGLGNLHGRLAFNSSWFAVAAVLEAPLLSGKGIHLLSPLLLWFYGLAAGSAIRRLQRECRWSLADIVLALSAVLLLGDLVRWGVSSAAPDLAVAALVLLATVAALQALEGRLAWPYAILVTSLLGLFGLTVKLSAAPLLVFPVALGLAAWRRRAPVAWRAIGAAVAGLGGVLLVPWAARGLLLSGCWAYPASFTCFPHLRWAIPPDLVAEELVRTRAWARARTVSPDVMVGWGWLGPWIEWTLFYRTVDGLLAVGLVLATLVWTAVHGLWSRARVRVRGLAWVAVPLAIGVAYWFLTAPDRRFGYGYVWSLLLLGLGVLLVRSGREPALRWRAQLRRTLPAVAVGAVIVAAVGLGAIDLGRQGAVVTRVLLRWPPVPAAQVADSLTTEGAVIHVVVTPDLFCQASPFPCTPDFEPRLRVVRDSRGWYRMFLPPARAQPLQGRTPR
jgi:hypothetical protein